jgi:hypothetical protein
MTQRTTEDIIRTAFADLRSTEVIWTKAPGVGAVRRSVRRRRVGVAVGATGLAAVAVLGGAYVADTQHRADPLGPDGTVHLGPAATADPDLQQLVNDAVAQNGEGGIATLLLHQGDSPLDMEPQAISAEALVPGAAVLRVACAAAGGTASATVSSGADQRTATAQCALTAEGIAAGAGETTVVVSGPGEWTALTLEPDDAAPSSSGEVLVAASFVNR